MLHFPRWKSLSILAAVLLAVLMALPNVLSPAWQERLKPYGLKPMTLGLDLQGGSNVLMEIDRADLRDTLLKQVAGDVRGALRDASISYSGMNRTADGVTVRITTPGDLTRTRLELAKLKQPLEDGKFNASGTVNLFDLTEQDQRFSLELSAAGFEAKMALAMDQTLKVIKYRSDPDGIYEPIIQQQGSDRIAIQLPGVQNADEFKKKAVRPARLVFQLLCEEQPVMAGQRPPPGCAAYSREDGQRVGPMLHFPRWKSLSILAAVLLAVLMALPNVLSPAWQERLKPYGLRPMTLGLDLQGGSNVLMEIDRDDLKDTLSKQVAGDIRAALREAKIAYSGINRTAGGITVRITKPEDVDKARTELEKILVPVDTGLFGGVAQANLMDLSVDGQQFAFTFSEAGLDAKVAAAIAQSLKIIEKRVNPDGTFEPVIQQQGQDRIVIQLPGIQNPDEIKGRLGQTAKLTFQLVCEEQPTGQGQAPPPECIEVKMKPDASRPDQPETMWVQTSSRATVDGADLVDARPGFDQNNQPIVSFRFNTRGAERFGKLTADNVNKPFAIILDEVIQSAPNINEPILGGSGQISGNFTVEETNELAIVLRSGALPAKLTIVEERTVGPSLGSDSIRAGVLASLVGLVGVLIFMIVAYGLFGIFANIALVVNLLALIALMSFFGFTLTLPGIAGIVLTMGMAVDSNVLIYERIREEWRAGRSALNAIETGFKAALGTIWDANLTTLAAAVALFGVGSGPIRGFAVTLFIGIITTMFTAFTLTQLIVSIWVKWKRPKEVPL